MTIFFKNINIKKLFENDWLDMIMQFSDICESLMIDIFS